MKISSNTAFPGIEVDKWLADNKDAIIAELKEYYEGCLDNCGPDDEINTLPAKELYEKAGINILSCKDEIEKYFALKEYCDGILAELKASHYERRSIFKVAK